MRRIAAAFSGGSLAGGVLVAVIVVYVLHDVDPDLKNALGTAFRGLLLETIVATLVESGIFLLGILAIRSVRRTRMDATHASVAFWIAGGARLLEYGWSAYVRWGLKLGGADFDLLLLVSMLLIPLLCATLFAVVALHGHGRG